MNPLEMIKSRRSIRQFEEKGIADETLNQILEAARWAPSWANTQCWEVILVKDPNLKLQLQQLLTDNNPAARAMIRAPVIIALCGKLETSGFYKGRAYTKFRDWFMYDLGIVTQNISLSAHALGLGSVVIGAFDHDKAKGLLDIPDGYEIVSLIPIGYPHKIPAPPKRKELADFTHLDRFKVDP
ncbi:nitroreductase [Geothermobacter hydrogeniphilus]|uniref:Nitroreductase n=1 Tax=Geothermobacter hydrogeniphilus TaxID=1969733 RepID=A0A2K2H7D5_9BACT|nr:nitroreductase family protein [Geothermobacter hydrogeniphilus]PNU19224.1 nitroreductase [Geothermobacter hydrogeniphilus]